MLKVGNLTAILSKSFRLDDLSFAIADKERVAVLGPNGSGKSYLLRLILGLERPTSGTIAWDDELLSGAGKVVIPPELRGMGVVFQEGALFPHLDVRQNVALALSQKRSKLTPRERDAQVDGALELARIQHLHDRSLQSLSGGEQQRVAIARALAHRPRLLLLDEPFHSLDGPLKREVLADVRELVERRKITTVLVTHDTDEAASFADRVLLLRKGLLLQEGSFESLYTEPVDRAAAEFLGPVETLELQQAAEAEIQLPADLDKGKIYFRREHLQLSKSTQAAPTDLEIVDIQPHGLYHDISVKLADDYTIVARATGERSWRLGERVAARITRALQWPTSEGL